MRRTAFLSIILAMLLTLGGCAGQTANTEQTPDIDMSRFIEIGRRSDPIYSDFKRIIVDTETGVMYLYVKDGYSGGLTVMVDAEGNPLLYDAGE